MEHTDRPQSAGLGFDGAPSWNAVVRLPMFDSEDQTISAIVDRARALVGDRLV